MRRDGFFIGWAWRSAGPMAWLVSATAALLLSGAIGLGLALGSSVDDPGGGDGIIGRPVSGSLLLDPYPILVTDPDAAHPAGHAMPLAGGAKSGVLAEAVGLQGRRVQIEGMLVKRGSLDTLAVWAMKPVEGVPAVPAPVALGTWRLTGEICDGKCYAGVMRPGTGLAHKACANVCMLGGVPPVLVTTAPVAGTDVLLLADPDGKALPDAFRDHVAILQRMDGAVQRVADLLIFRTDIAAARDP